MTRGDVPYQILKHTKNSTTKAVWDSRRKLTNDKDTERRGTGHVDVYYVTKAVFQISGEGWRC